MIDSQQWKEISEKSKATFQKAVEKAGFKQLERGPKLLPENALSLRYQNAIMGNVTFISGKALRGAVSRIAGDSKLVVFGEKHTASLHRALLRKSLKSMKEAGVDSLAVEFLSSDMQPLLDVFGRYERGAIRGQLALKWGNYGKASAKAIFLLIKEAKRRGIHVVAMDEPSQGPKAPRIDEDVRNLRREGHMRGIIAQCLESGGVAVLCGKEHAMRIAGPFRKAHATAVVEFIGENPPEQKQDLFAREMSKSPSLRDSWFIMRGPRGMERNRFNNETEFPDWVIHIPEKRPH
jgi:hypothetical protein